MQIFKRLKDWSDSRGISAQKVTENDWGYVEDFLKSGHTHLKNRKIGGYVLNKIEELEEYSEAMKRGNINDAVDAIADSMVFDSTELSKMDFDNELVMDEVLKVVESRTGQWDDEMGKFMKDKSPEAQAKWYEPNYVKNCKLPVDKTRSLFGHGDL